jgi:hypothetical protein
MKSLSGLGRPGRSVLWIYAPGLYEARPGLLGTRNPARTMELTGMEMRVDDTVQPFSAVAALEGGGVAEFDAGVARPLVWCSDGDATCVATYKGSSRCAVAVKDRGGWLSMWSRAPNVPPELLRDLARRAGVHIFSDSGDPFYAGQGTISLHSSHAGTKRIVLPGRFDVEEVFSDTPLKLRATEVIECEMQSYETRIFRITPPR